MTKEEKFKILQQNILDAGFRIQASDDQRPWGGFFVIDENQSGIFIQKYFPDAPKNQQKISPKFLLVAPQKKLSWQYHHRRSEMWKVIDGRVGVVRSLNDSEGPMEILPTNTIITLQQGERHRLVGLDDWAVIAEIWIHTDPNNPSNEEDIVRVQDDFGR